MEDERIIDLFWKRDEQAVYAAMGTYGDYCHVVASNVLSNPADAEEAVADTWLRAWNSIPPQRPAQLKHYLAKITRGLALDIYRAQNAAKRGGGQVALALDELAACLPAAGTPEREYDARELEQTIAGFVKGLPARDRKVFVRRYFFLETAAQIGAQYGLRESNVLMILSRTRKKLKQYLIKEGYDL